MSSSQSAEIGLGHTILRRASLTPNARALTFEGQTWTCAELGDRVRRLATILRDGGVSRGDRIGYIGLNHPVFLELLYACGCVGAVFVPLNFRLTEQPEVLEKKETISEQGNSSKQAGVSKDTADWVGTVSEAEAVFITELIDGIDTIRIRRDGTPFTGSMRILNAQGLAQGEVNLLNGRLHGEEIFFDQTGEITERNFWDNGRPIGR